MKIKLCIFHLFILIFLNACSNRPKEAYPGWEQDIQYFKEGVSGMIRYSTDFFHSERLLRLLEHNKDRYFNDEPDFILFRGMLYIIEGELIEGFRLWREYSELTGDLISERVIFRRIVMTDYPDFAEFLVHDYEKEIIRSTGVINFDDDISRRLVGVQPFGVSHSYLEWYIDRIKQTDAIKGWENNIPAYDFESLKANKLEKSEISIRHMIHDEYRNWLIQQKNDNPELAHLIDHAEFQYLFRRGEFERAFEIAEYYEFDRSFNDTETMYNRLHGFLWNVPYIFFASGNLDKLIPFYESLTEDDCIGSPNYLYGRAPMEFWLAAAYAEQLDFDKAIAYLRAALANVSMWENQVDREIEHFEKNHLFAILWFSYMSTAMDPFREHQRFDEVESLLQKRLNDFSYLKWVK